MIIFKEPRADCWLPALIGAAGAIVGGLIGSSGSSKRQSSDQAFTAEQNRIAREEQAKQQAQDRILQRDFAQHGVSWKAADARRAGLDPVVAMGSSTTYSPVAMQVPAGQSYSSGGNDYSWMGKAGQNIGTAIQRFMTRNQMTTQMELNELAVERAHLENDKLMQENAARSISLNYPSQVAVPAPPGKYDLVDGQADAVVVQPGIQTTVAPGDHSRSSAVNPSQTSVIGPGNVLITHNNQDMGDALETDPLAYVMMTGAKVKELLKGGAARPKRTPNQVDKTFPKNWVWKRVRVIGMPAWKAVPPTRVPYKDRPGFVRHISRQPGLMGKNRAVLRNINKFRNQSY